MKIEVFEGQNKAELSMIEVAHAMLEQHGKEMEFSVLVNAIQDYLGRSDADIRANLSSFYTDLNTDGSFIPLGGNVWALRAWYAIDEINEEVIALDEVDDEDGEVRPKKKRKKVNAFADLDDAIDYSDDDPEDEDFVEEANYDDENPDDEKSEVEAYDSELAEVVLDEEDDENVELDEEDDDFEEDEDEEK